MDANVRIDRWASGDLDTSQGREDEPLGRVVWSLFVEVVVCAHSYATKSTVVPHCPFLTN